MTGLITLWEGWGGVGAKATMGIRSFNLVTEIKYS